MTRRDLGGRGDPNNQLREKGIIVNDIPLIRLPNDQRKHESHSIIDKFSGMHIPLMFKKPILLLLSNSYGIGMSPSRD
jgi:uncharacterized protein YccT (UPF0319 family)